MGNLFGCCKRTCGKRTQMTRFSKKHNNTNIQILVAGDSKVGKSTLINNYVSDSDEVTFANKSEMIRIVNAQQLITDPNDPDKTTSVHVSIIEVEGSSNETNKQLRECYYATSQIVLVLYNVNSVESLYNVRKTWQAEIDDTVAKYHETLSGSELTEENFNSMFKDVQLVLVGVNPEARDREEVEVCNDFVEDDDEETDFKFSRNVNRRRSVSKKEVNEISETFSMRGSFRKTKHKEVPTTKADINRFFSELISDYVYGS